RLVQDGDRFRVITSVGEAHGAATARRIDPPPIGGTGARAGLAPAMLAALARADELLGVPVPITSGYRSIADQQRLWDNRHTNPYPVARPGRSRHHAGLAVDVPSAFVPRLLGVAAQSGLCQPLPQTDPIHFEICGSR
ncbi:MAG: M15 family metallopeptidase, partial [Actinomycetota bacterium]